MSTNAELAPPTAHRPLQVVYKAITSLVPDPRNARMHPKRQIEQIVASIRAFGFTNPILADPEGNLIAGHGRLRAAKELGLAEVPVIELVGLTEPQKKALRLADNKIALNAGWDVEILKLELADLSLPDIAIDLSLTGFSVGEIDVVLAGSPDPDDEVIPEVPVSPRVQPGDIWQLGEHRIGCGDGRDKVLAGDSAAARASLEAIETARARRPVDSHGIKVITISFIGNGISTILEPLGVARHKYPEDKERVRWELNPWIVDAALARLGSRRLTTSEQREVWANTRTPQKVRWPEWWTEKG